MFRLEGPLAGPPRGFEGPQAKAKDQAPCEQKSFATTPFRAALIHLFVTFK